MNDAIIILYFYNWSIIKLTSINSIIYKYIEIFIHYFKITIFSS